jgi:hypothetical protein
LPDADKRVQQIPSTVRRRTLRCDEAVAAYVRRPAPAGPDRINWLRRPAPDGDVLNPNRSMRRGRSLGWSDAIRQPLLPPPSPSAYRTQCNVDRGGGHQPHQPTRTWLRRTLIRPVTKTMQTSSNVPSPVLIICACTIVTPVVYEMGVGETQFKKKIVV